MKPMGAVVEGREKRIVAWRDSIPLRYEYTAGAAGEAFLRGLLEGRILASKCSRCGEVRLPPRSYCLQCYGRASVDVEVMHFGRLSALTRARGTTFGFVTFAGVSGGLLHRVLSSGRVRPALGDTVRPVFAPSSRRSGSILDIEGFEVPPRRAGKR